MRIKEEEGHSESVSSSGQVSFPTPSLQLSSTSDESLALLYLSHSDEVELMVSFAPADVISVLRLGSRMVGEAELPAGRFCCLPGQARCINTLHHQPARFKLCGYNLERVPIQGSANIWFNFWENA